MNFKNDVDSLFDSSCSLSNSDGICNASDGSFAKNRYTTTSSIRDSNGEFICKSSSCLDDSDNSDLKKEIYRFKFTDVFMEELHQFSKIHPLENRKDFKESWILWTKEHSIMIQEEIDRLHKLGFQGDVLDKMFKSTRYYFRKKKNVKEKLDKDGKVEKEEVNRKYQCSSKLLLETMDFHIKKMLSLKNSIKKPSIAFLDFCKENKDLLKEEIIDLNQQGIIELKDVLVKIKKTYKNKYFSIVYK